jgi:hypothetical protein
MSFEIVEPEYTAEQIAAMSHEVCGILSLSSVLSTVLERNVRKPLLCSRRRGTMPTKHSVSNTL